MRNWARAALARLDAHDEAALVTVLATEGSAPREAGTKMVVWRGGQSGTIGGGNLEFQAIDKARALLAEGRSEPLLADVALGPELAQCCGGALTLLYEPFPARGRLLVLCGAGHVGRALVDVLGPLGQRVLWLDTRADAFPAAAPAGTVMRATTAPAAEIRAVAPGSLFLIMTHDHDLDLSLCEAVLARGDAGYAGLIGSKTKRARFDRRLAAAGFDPAAMVCPIGLPDIETKHPQAIAISVAADLMARGLIAT